jgi:Fungal specific transcription factor domain
MISNRTGLTTARDETSITVSRVQAIHSVPVSKAIGPAAYPCTITPRPSSVPKSRMSVISSTPRSTPHTLPSAPKSKLPAITSAPRLIMPALSSTPSLIMPSEDHLSATDDDLEEVTDSSDVEVVLINSRAFKPVLLPQPILDIALSFVVNEYVPNSHFEYLPEMLNRYSGSSKSIIHSTYAAALANLARSRKDNQLMLFAKKTYGNAVKYVNSALRSPEALSDSALVAVLILALFEVFMFEENVSFKSWVAHSNGALALLNYRGDKLLRTPFGKRIYIQVANQIRANCLQQEIRLPRMLIEMDKEMAPFLTDDMHPLIAFWQIIPIEIHYMAARPELYSARDIIAFGVDEDSQQVEIMKTSRRHLTPIGLSFEQAPAPIFKKFAFTKNGLNLIRFLNTCHLMRLMRLERVQKCVDIMLKQSEGCSIATRAWLDFRESLERVGRSAADGILATVPFYLPTSEKEPVNTTFATFLVWPLACFAEYRLITPEQRHRAREALRQIGLRGKLPVATMVANNFKGGSIRFQQLHMLHLG